MIDFDRQFLLELVGSKYAFSILTNLRGNTDRMVHRLMDTIRAGGESSNVYLQAHALKGVLVQCGFSNFGEYMNNVAQNAATFRDVDGLEQRYLEFLGVLDAATLSFAVQ
jgi:hypothetical protein